MKRTLSVVSAALFAGALAMPAMAQVGGDVKAGAGVNTGAPASAAGAAASGAVSGSTEVVKKTAKKAKHAAKKKADAATSTTGGAMGGMDMNATTPGAGAGADVKGGVNADTPKQ